MKITSKFNKNNDTIKKKKMTNRNLYIYKIIIYPIVEPPTIELYLNCAHIFLSNYSIPKQLIL